MRLASLSRCGKALFLSHTLSVAVRFSLMAATLAAAEDIKLNLTYVCNGERIYVENCNIRDLSDMSTCTVAHPDRPQHNGFMAYTTETRGTLKKLFPTCKQPTAQETAAEDAFKKKQQEIYDANVRKANPQTAVVNQQQAAVNNYQPQQLPPPPKSAEERAMRRCISSGRLPATCTGNSLLGAFGQMLSSVLPGANKEPPPGPNMAGVFQGAGNWRLDFIDGGVLVNCSFLSPNQENYTIDFKTGRAVLTIDTKPKPLVLTFKPDGTIVGPGPVTVDGVIAAGYTSDAPSNATKQDQFGNLYDSAGNRVGGNANTGHTNFASRRATCPALNLTSKGAGVGLQTMQTDLLKTAFGGDKGPPTPPGIRMHGIFAASTGLSVQFFPESVILGIGTRWSPTEPSPKLRSTLPITRSPLPFCRTARSTPAPGLTRCTGALLLARTMTATSRSCQWSRLAILLFLRPANRFPPSEALLHPLWPRRDTHRHPVGAACPRWMRRSAMQPCKLFPAFLFNRALRIHLLDVLRFCCVTATPPRLQMAA